MRAPKGEVGRDVAELIGEIVVINEQLAGLRRKVTDPYHYLIIDEAHNFIGHVDFENYASEMRKYNVPLFLVTQYLDHFPSLSALFGNFPNGVIYRVSGKRRQARRGELPYSRTCTLDRQSLQLPVRYCLRF